MSFNVNTVNNVEPTKDGNIPLTVPKALGSTDSYSVGDTVVFNASSSAWEALVIPPSAATEFAMFGQGEANDYANSGLTLAVDSTLGFYDSSPYNTFTEGVVTFNLIAGTNWLESVTIAAGAYEFYIQADIEYSALGLLSFHIVDDTDTSLCEVAISGGALSTIYGNPVIISHVVEFSTTTTIRVRIDDVVNSASSQGNAVSERCFVIIRRA